MKSLFISFLVCSFAASGLYAESFYLEHDGTGKTFGPFQFMDLEKMEIQGQTFTLFKDEVEETKPNQQVKPVYKTDTKSKTSDLSGVEWETAGYFKNSDRTRMLSKYPSKKIDSDSITKRGWGNIIKEGLSEMQTEGRNTWVFFYKTEKQAWKSRLHQHKSVDAAMDGAYYAKPFAVVQQTSLGEDWLVKYPETDKEETVKL